MSAETVIVSYLRVAAEDLRGAPTGAGICRGWGRQLGIDPSVRMTT